MYYAAFKNSTLDSRETQKTDDPLSGDKQTPGRGGPLRPCSPRPTAGGRASWTGATLRGCTEPSCECGIEMKLFCKGEKRLDQRLKSPQSANPVSPRADDTTHRQGQRLPVAIPTPVPAAFCSAQTQPLRLNMSPSHSTVAGAGGQQLGGGSKNRVFAWDQACWSTRPQG